MTRSIRFLVAASLISLSASAGAEVRKCVTADGRVTYTDRPCTTAEESAPVNTGAAINSYSSQEASQGISTYLEDRRRESDAAAEAKAEAARAQAAKDAAAVKPEATSNPYQAAQ